MTEVLEALEEECINYKLKIFKSMNFETSIRIETELGSLVQNRSFINGTAPLNPDEWKGKSSYYILKKLL